MSGVVGVVGCQGDVLTAVQQKGAGHSQQVQHARRAGTATRRVVMCIN